MVSTIKQTHFSLLSDILCGLLHLLSSRTLATNLPTLPVTTAASIATTSAALCVAHRLGGCLVHGLDSGILGIARSIRMLQELAPKEQKAGGRPQLEAISKAQEE